MCEENEYVTKIEFESPGFEEKKKKREAEGLVLESCHGSFGASYSGNGVPDPHLTEYVGRWVSKKDPKNSK